MSSVLQKMVDKGLLTQEEKEAFAEKVGKALATLYFELQKRKNERENTSENKN